MGLVGGLSGGHADLEVERGFFLMGSQISQFSRDFKGKHKLAQSREAVVEIDNRISRTVLTTWIIGIILLLSVRGSSRFEEIRRSLPGISGKVLSRKLTFLERKGLVIRTVSESKPTKVEYQLSSKGGVLAALGEPVMMYLRYLEDSR